MRFSTALFVWVLLVLATVAELALFRTPLDRTLFTVSLFGLAGLKALMIAVFYQQVTREGGDVAVFYFFTLWVALGLIIGVLTSMSQITATHV
jgi:hypothetical protein